MPDVTPNTKKRILIVVPFTFPYHAGGGLSALNFAEYINTHGHTAWLLTLNRGLKLPLKSNRQHTNIYRIPYLRKGIILKLFSLIIILPCYLLHILRCHSVIIYGGYIIAWEFIVFIGKLMNKRVIFRSTMFQEDDIQSLLESPGKLNIIRKNALKIIDSYFSLTPSFTKSYLSVFSTPDKIIESTQGVNIENFNPANLLEKKLLRRKLGLPTDSLILISVGIVTSRKGYSKLFCDLKNLKIDFKYYVVGDYETPRYSHLNSKYLESNRTYHKGLSMFANKIHFLGFVDNVPDYLKAADIFLMASTKEGLPNALLEAMACGLTILTRNLNELSGYLIVDGINGIIVKENNTFSEFIHQLSQDSAARLKFGEEAYKTIKQSHTFEKVFEKIT